jgi:lipopolysaccharide transport system ATP-binding protein
MAAVVQVEGLGKRYMLGNTAGGYSRLTEDITDAFARLFRRTPDARVESTARELWALRDVSLEIDEGEIVGVIGRNGAGKTTLLKVLARITDPTEGRAVIAGRVGSLLEVGTGFHPELTGRENVFLNGAILGMRRSEIRSKFDDIVEFAELQRFIDTPVKRYSSGMYVRLAFAVAAYLEPEILFVDEVLSVGDQAFQQRCIGRMGEIATSGRTILFVSHNLASVSALCSRGILMDSGGVVVDGPVDDVIDHYVSSIQSVAGQSLDHREDRQGDGRLRIAAIDVASANGGPARTGVDCDLCFTYRSTVSDGNLAVSIGVEGPLGEPIFFGANAITGEPLVLDGFEGQLVCSIPSMPLLPGRYSLTYYIEVNGELADWVRNAIYFEVFESDVLGTGRLPPTTHGRVLVPQAWAVRSVQHLGS